MPGCIMGFGAAKVQEYTDSYVPDECAGERRMAGTPVREWRKE